MSKSLFVANYIIEYADEIGAPVNNMKLQKLLYYVQSAVLMEASKPLFEEKIEKWRLGPVIPEVYYEYKGFGARNILASDIVKNIFRFKESEKIEFDIIPYTQNDIKYKEIIEKVVDNLKEYTPFQLVDFTKYQEVYLKDITDIDKGKRKFYDINEMFSYYKNNPESMIWK